MRISDWSSDVCSSDLGLLLEQVDDRRAVQAEAGLAHRLLQPRGALGAAEAAQVQADVDRAVEAAELEPDHVDEQELLRQHEVLLQQPVAQERARLVLEQALVVVEADRAHRVGAQHLRRLPGRRSEEHTSELQSLMRNSYAVFCLKKKNTDQ